MVDRELITERLSRLRDYLKWLQSVADRGRDAYLGDPLLRAAGERYLQLCLEVLFDIGGHVIADRGLAKPDSYAEIFEILHREGLVPDDLHAQLAGMAGFRNLLVHDYLRLDPERVFDMLGTKLPVLEALARVFAGELD